LMGLPKSWAVAGVAVADTNNRVPRAKAPTDRAGTTDSTDGTTAAGELWRCEEDMIKLRE
ncbi:MAG: hypothetical protein ACYS5W_05035, partial [Planctomycetota bacterium]